MSRARNPSDVPARQRQVTEHNHGVHFSAARTAQFPPGVDSRARKSSPMPSASTRDEVDGGVAACGGIPGNEHHRVWRIRGLGGRNQSASDARRAISIIPRQRVAYANAADECSQPLACEVSRGTREWISLQERARVPKRQRARRSLAKLLKLLRERRPAGAFTESDHFAPTVLLHRGRVGSYS
jgi:hypothetical protein